MISTTTIYLAGARTTAAATGSQPSRLQPPGRQLQEMPGANIPDPGADTPGGGMAREAGAGPGAAAREMADGKSQMAKEGLPPEGGVSATHAAFAITGIARAVRHEFARGAGRQMAAARLKRHPYWPTFCALAKAGSVPAGFAGAWSAWTINLARE